ncbi:MAG TPA: cytochrome c maturation protein CcmE [Rhodobiaceae bacterium]|nr:MAG: Cytochrome c-type biogenesis protein CcmE [Rhodobiaceae bacterium UBA7378]HCQ81954.1 cytochrome c maturation protein CcmE [Rhodobiaceae bacterium]|tara:strand:+ start:204 stop:692 length:489 start_codon:yes stop_codon:yes gene_type:complete
MSPKRARAAMIISGLGFLALAATLALTALEDNIVFFRAPSELARAPVEAGIALRVGGLVGENTVRRDGLNVRFQITDLAHDVEVRYTGMLPDLFREGQGVVAEGRFDTAGVFVADTVLAKHDETYMPPEVAEALKASGRWQADARHPGEKTDPAAAYGASAK